MSIFKLIIAVNFFVYLFVYGFELEFKNSNENSNVNTNESITIGFTGDILIHKDLYEKVIKGKKSSFLSLWSKTIPLIEKADLTYGNLEGPVALGINDKKIDKGDIGFKYDGSIYSGTNMLFNYHPQIITDLKDSGFDIVSTSNNHTLDRGSIGIDRTIDALNERKLDFIGTRKKDSKEEFFKIVSVKNFKVAWISCTELLNEFRDKHLQTIRCYNQSDEIVKLILKIKTKNLADVIILTPHWGKEYQDKPNEDQKKYASLFAEAGADAIIGSHPHVLQPVEKYVTKDQRKVFIAYSLGNFLAYQRNIERRSSAFIYLTFQKSKDSLRFHKSVITNYSYQPTYRENKEIIPANNLPNVVKHVEKYLGKFKD